MKILVLDDDPIILNLATDLLRDSGYDVTSLNKPQEALEKLKEGDYDLLVTDIMMPHINGLDVIKELGKINKKTKAIVMTGFGDLETAQSAIKEGAYDYILKPFNNDVFRNAVKNALTRKELEEENIKLKEFTGLMKFSELITSHLTPQNLPEIILGAITSQLKATKGSLMLLDKKTNELQIAAAIGINEDIIKETQIKIGEGIAGKVVKEGNPLLVNNIDTHPNIKNLSHGHSDKAFMSVPMNLGEDALSIPLVTSHSTIGVINLRRDKNDPPFRPPDLELLSILSVQAAIAIENHRLLSDLNTIYLGVIQFVVALTEARDVYLRGHTKRVTNICLRLGHYLNLTPQELIDLKYAAILHDIGKLAISENLLNKKGNLTYEEFEIIKKHPSIGADILKSFKFLKNARKIVLHHHERLDGKGYPEGLSGDQISIPTHIIILADAFDAMNSDRAYRKALSKKDIYKELEQNKGTQFHPQVVKALLQLLKNNRKNHG